MSADDSVEVFDRWAYAWLNGDRKAFVELFDPQAELFLPRSAIEGTVYRGLDGAGRAFDDGNDAWDWSRSEIIEPWREVRSHGDCHLLVARVRLQPRGPGPAVEYDAFWLFELRARRIACAHPYQDEREALTAFETRTGG